ncbi:PIN domain nuclease [Streptomyces sp. ME02-8801-2C]|uniref:PIN domain nuclease n=1 Tax=Streptomyces sp. ME02-8801-2C TaxID=3028680 RepID=UPI0029A73A94|nr:PIN domain nuclease [Streptomyces sp. ME02-8801-2C]MDX3454645.1 PIN domain nuclease [Streptomyces sp. ME02-8801-2C]
MSLATYLIDTSAAARLLTNKGLREQWSDALAEGVVGMCELTELEMHFSARSLMDRLENEELFAELFNWIPMPDGVYQRARAVQRRLTESGEHCSAGAVDLLLAATAELSGLAVLHYDADFETVAKVTGQPTRWVARGGTL